MLGIVVAAVARRLVPKFSAPTVTKSAQNPVPKPMIPHAQYSCSAEDAVKKRSIPIAVIA